MFLAKFGGQGDITVGNEQMTLNPRGFLVIIAALCSNRT